jgi:hypothetical protein
VSIGSFRKRLPVAAKIALVTAGTMAEVRPEAEDERVASFAAFACNHRWAGDRAFRSVKARGGASPRIRTSKVPENAA